MDNQSVEAHRQELQQLSEELQALKQIVSDAMLDAEQGYLNDILPEMKKTEEQAVRVAGAGDTQALEGLARLYGMHQLRAEQCKKNWEIFQNLALAISAAESLWKRRLTASTVVASLTNLMHNMGQELPSSKEEFESAANFQHWTEQTGGSVQGLLTSLTALVTESSTSDFYLAPELALENHPNFDQYKSEFKKLVSDRLGTTETT